MGVFIESFEYIARTFDATRVSGELKRVAPVFDLYLEFIFDLAQVFVKLTTQPGKAAGICWLQF